MPSKSPSTPEVPKPRSKSFDFLAGQTALVTGASSGIGTGIALSLADFGANVIVNYRGDEEAARKVADGIEARGRQALVHKADISDRRRWRSSSGRPWNGSAGSIFS